MAITQLAAANRDEHRATQETSEENRGDALGMGKMGVDDVEAAAQMKDGDREDYAFLTEHEIEYAAGTADRLLAAMVDLDK